MSAPERFKLNWISINPDDIVVGVSAAFTAPRRNEFNLAEFQSTMIAIRTGEPIGTEWIWRDDWIDARLHQYYVNISIDTSAAVVAFN